MPKAAKNSKFSRISRRLAAADPLPLKSERLGAQSQQEELTEGSENLSRGQRKRLAKREQYKKREKIILSSLRLKSLEEKKGINGLDSIREALIRSTKDRVQGALEPRAQMTNKSKRKLVSEEVHHMGLVLQHPSFKANPFETMQEHLRNTLAQQKAELELKAKECSSQEKVQRELKRMQKKERLQGVKKIKKKYNATRSKY
ncbi:unnamed protein product [Cylindrotheca closterium]|uniref:Uncharacterized protein n=1 Tax=Cylindrotheca closterium TaxID=2856 RepID=A0AAD2FN75_9STRA|nr:unnamed protein product [Cylindrotheca closterium]